MIPEDEDALLVRARAGDGAALETLLERVEPQIFRFARTMCRDEEDARDVLQETMLAMARGLGTFRGESRLATWLYTIARSHCLKKRRRSLHAGGPERSLDTDAREIGARLADPSSPPDEALAERELARGLADAIDALDEGNRDVILLRDVEGLTAPEVGEVLGLSVQAVKSRLHRARAAVRERIAGHLAPPPAAPAAGCPDVATMLSRHLEDELDAASCADMEHHLAGCSSCHGLCASLRQVLALCRTSAPTGPVPPEIKRSVRAALTAFLAARG